MSLIRIRGRTILSPILSESERLEARALRDQAVHSHHQRQKDYSRQSSRLDTRSAEKEKTPCETRGVCTSQRSSLSTPKNKCNDGETSSSSAPSSGGEVLTGPEDSPSAANVSVQTESSMSLTASTDLRSYLNTSLDTSLDTSTSASFNTRHQSSSMAQVDEALLLSVSPEIATDLILGRVHPSSILNQTIMDIQNKQADSQRTDTASATLTQEQQAIEKQNVPEGQDATTSVSLSLASFSEEGGDGSEEGLEASEELLEVSEVMDGSEEDRDLSLPSEAESDWHKDETDDSHTQSSHTTSQKRGSASSFDMPRDLRVSALREGRDSSWSMQRDSGRSSSHSDYLDDYLELLTSRSSSSLGLQTAGVSVASSKMAAPVTTSSSTRSVITASSTEHSDQRKSSVGRVNTSFMEKKSLDSAEPLGKKEDTDLSKIFRKEGTKCRSMDEEMKDETRDKRRSKDRDWPKDIVEEPRSSSAALERRSCKPKRERRLSYQQGDPSRSVGSKYLDSYLGNLTDDAWLQYPTSIESRHMVYLDSDDYMQTVRPQQVKKRGKSQSSAEQTESSASEDSRRQDFSTASSYSPQSNVSGSIREDGSEASQKSRDSSSSCQVESKHRGSVGSGKETKDSPLAQQQHPSEFPKDTVMTENVGLKGNKDSLNLSSLSEQSQEGPVIVSEETQKSEKSPQMNDTAVCKQNVTVAEKQKINENDQNNVIADNDPNISDASVNTHVSASDSPEKAEIISEETIEENQSQKGGDNCLDDNSNVDHERNTENAVPAFKIGNIVETIEHEESSSDESSETEPSTIVYVDDYPCEVRSTLAKEPEKQVHSALELNKERSEEAKLHAELEKMEKIEDRSSVKSGIEIDKPKKINLEDSHIDNDHTSDILSKDLAVRVDNEKRRESIKSGNGSVQEPESMENALKQVEIPEVEENIKKEKTNNDQTINGQVPLKSSAAETLSQEELYDSDEECLVIQVTERNDGNYRQTSDWSTSKSELKNEGEVVEIVAQSLEKTDNEMELALETSNNMRDLVPEKVTEDAMNQVLNLLRAKQRQELEALRRRQEEEVRQFIQQLQRVSPKQLQAFLAASTITCGSIEGRPDEDLCVRSDGNIAISDVDNVKISKDRVIRGSGHGRTHAEVGMYNKNENSDVSSGRGPKEEHSRYLVSSKPRQELGNKADTISVMHPCASTSATLPSTCASANLPSRAYNERISGADLKPRPSNHTNIMPSYFVNEESRKAADALGTVVMAGEPSSHLSSTSHHVSYPGTSPSYTQASETGPAMHARNNNIPMEALDAVNYANGNCVSYGDGMQYYRLFTADDEGPGSRTSRPPTVLEPVLQPNSSQLVTQPGLFRVVSGSPWPSPRPASITSLLAEHPEMFGDEVVEVNLQQISDWGAPEVDRREPKSISQHSSGPHLVKMSPHSTGRQLSNSSCVRGSSEEGGLDMVPERESAASVYQHSLSQSAIFIRGITLLQACVRRFLTQRLFRTKFVQEQLGILAEIAKLAQQFHTDILTDNIHKGDVDFHKALYNQEGMARERIRRVFVVLTVPEQMSLIRRDRQLWKMQQEREMQGPSQASPSHAHTIRSRSGAPECRSRGTPTRIAKKRPSVPQQRTHHESKARSTHSGRSSQLVQPSVIAPQSSRPCGSSEHRLSPKVSKVPMQGERSSSHLGSPVSHHYIKQTSHIRSPSQDSRSTHHTSSTRCSVHPRSSSTSQLESRSGSHHLSRSTSHLPGSQHMPRSSAHQPGKTNSRPSSLAGTRSTCTVRSTPMSNSPRRGKVLIEYAHTYPYSVSSDDA